MTQKLGYVLIFMFLCAFKNCESFIMSAHLSARMEQLGSHWMNFHIILYLRIFRKSVEKIQVSLKSNKNNSSTLHEDRYTFLIISHSVLLRMRNVSDTSHKENQNTIFHSIIFST